MERRRRRRRVAWRSAAWPARGRRLRPRRRARRRGARGRGRASPARCRCRSSPASGSSPASAAPRSRRQLRAGDPRGTRRRRRPLRRQLPQPRRRPAPDRPAAGDPAAAGAARPAAGDGRPGGRAGEAGRRRADRLGAADGRARRRLQPPAGPAHGREPARARRQRRPRAGARRRPPRRRRSPQPNAASARPPRRSPRPRSRSPQALQAGGVAATAKHFPGFGAAPRKHRLRGAADRPLRSAKLRAVDEAPYRAFAAAGGELVMLSTAIYPAFSADPAAFTRPIATGELRDRLGFEGVSITDALDTRRRSRTSAARRRPASPAARAGADLLLFTDLGAGRTGLAGAGRRSCAPAPSTAANSRPRPSACSTCVAELAPLARRSSSASSRIATGSKTRTPSRPPSLAAYIAVSASETTDVEAGAGIVAEHRDADAGGDRVGAVRRSCVLADRARRSPRPPMRASSRLQRGRTPRTRRRRAGRATSLSRVRRRSTSAISLISAVAGRVAVGVVDLLEVVEVEHQQRAGRAVAAAARHRRRAGPPRSGAGSSARSARPGSPAAPAPASARCGSRRGSARPSSAASGDPEIAEQQRQADAGPLGVPDDQQPGAVGDVDRGAGGVVELAARARATSCAVDPQLHVDVVGERRRSPPRPGRRRGRRRRRSRSAPRVARRRSRSGRRRGRPAGRR